MLCLKIKHCEKHGVIIVANNVEQLNKWVEDFDKHGESEDEAYVQEW